MVRLPVSLLAIVEGEAPVDDAPAAEPVPVDEPVLDAVVLALDAPLPVVDGVFAAEVDEPVVDPVVELFIAEPLVEEPVLLPAAGYCGVAPGVLVDWVVVDCAYGAEHHTAAIMAPIAKSFERLFIGDLHTEF